MYKIVKYNNITVAIYVEKNKYPSLIYEYDLKNVDKCFNDDILLPMFIKLVLHSIRTNKFNEKNISKIASKDASVYYYQNTYNSELAKMKISFKNELDMSEQIEVLKYENNK